MQCALLCSHVVQFAGLQRLEAQAAHLLTMPSVYSSTATSMPTRALWIIKTSTLWAVFRWTSMPTEMAVARQMTTISAMQCAGASSACAFWMQSTISCFAMLNALCHQQLVPHAQASAPSHLLACSRFHLHISTPLQADHGIPGTGRIKLKDIFSNDDSWNHPNAVTSAQRKAY